MPEKKLIEPRARTPAPGSREMVVTGRLPEDLLSEQLQRFGVFTVVAAGRASRRCFARHTSPMPPPPSSSTS